MPSEKALQHATELARLIGRVRRLNRNRVTKALQEHRETLPAWQVIANVKWQGAMTQNALADHIGAHAASISRLLDQLEKKGLIRRASDPDDRRCITVHLTDKGEAWYRRVHTGPMTELFEVMSRLSRAEQAQLEKLLLKLSPTE